MNTDQTIELCDAIVRDIETRSALRAALRRAEYQEVRAARHRQQGYLAALSARVVLGARAQLA